MWPRLFERIRHLDRVEWVAVSLVSSVSLMIGLGGALAFAQRASGTAASVSMEDPCHPNYPAALKATVGPRNMVHSWATTVDDATAQPRWGKVGKQRIEDAGELCT